MSFKILSQALVSEFHTEPTLNLVGNIEDKITATIDCVFEGGIYYATPSFPIIYGSPNTNDPNYQKYISVNQPVFSAFRVGDSISILDPAQPNDGITATITEIVNDTKFIIDTALTIGTNSTTGVILNETPMQGLKFSYGLPDNTAAPTITSRIDGSIQEFRFDGYPTGSTPLETMSAAGSKSWQRGSVTVQRLSTGTGNGQQQFRFVHTFYIDPTYLAGQLNNFGSDQEPAYFVNNSLRYDFLIQGGRDLSNDSLLRKSLFNRILGNVGWFGENFAGGFRSYILESTTYKKLPSLEEINGIELVTDEQQIELVIKDNVSGAGNFVDLASQFRISHHYLPSNAGEYQNNDKTVEENFYIDRAFLYFKFALL